MLNISPISRAWVWANCRPFLVSWLVLMAVSSLLLTVQLILRAPFVPDPLGVICVWLALLPETTGMLAPAALLLGVVLTARKWSQSGDVVALAAAGVPAGSLFLPTLVLGAAVSIAIGVCTQVLGPMGRAGARSVLLDAAENAQVRPGEMIQVGDVWLRVGRRHGLVLEDVTIVSSSWAAWAPKGQQMKSGALELSDGRARSLEQEWTLDFDTASIALDSRGLGVHNFERSSRELMAHIDRMESNGRDAARERLTLYKRTTLPLLAPLLAWMGIPLGLSGRRPYFTTSVVILLVWAIQRLGDHGVGLWGPEVMAVVPLLVILFMAVFVHRRWSGR